MAKTTAAVHNLGLVEGSQVRPEVAEILADVFQFDGTINLETSQQDVEKWDSLRHIALVAALESRFGISLSMDEMMEIIRVCDIQRVLERHGVWRQ